MKDYLTLVNEKFPVRQKKEQKDAFFAFVKGEAEACGKEVRIETNEKHNNIVFGDVERAKVILGAHYDTPKSSLIPNLMLPRNPVLGTLIGLGAPVLVAILSLVVAFLVANAFSLPQPATVLIYLVLYFSLFLLVFRYGINPHNANDNTSGVAVLLSLLPELDGDEVAFVLFDDEEKGLLGSKAFCKAHGGVLKEKLVLSFDCVGNGDEILLIAKEEAERTKAYDGVKEAFQSDDRFHVHFFPKKGSLGNSDYKSFPCGVGVMACREKKGVGFYTDRIHTPKDTVADPENIRFLANATKNFIKTL